MSVVVKETPDAKKINRATDGSRTASRSFIVYDDEGDILTASDVVTAYGLPFVGQVYPDAGGLFASGYNLSLHNDRKNTWVVDWSYNTIQITEDDSEGDPSDTTPLETNTSITVGLTILDMYKSGFTLPSAAADINDPSPNGTDFGDIGGSLTDSGYPISFALPTADIKITKSYTGFFNGAGFLSVTGTRNSNGWMGFPAGSLLFTGIGYTSKGGNTYDLTFNIAYDDWFHLRQVPDRAVGGKPNYNATTKTMDVFWRQPFNDTSSFTFLPF
tara:strand:+ start:10027 stop:10842 length:816 start_codon:yes stop_codon:yes gene_type:complete